MWCMFSGVLVNLYTLKGTQNVVSGCVAQKVSQWARSTLEIAIHAGLAYTLAIATHAGLECTLAIVTCDVGFACMYTLAIVVRAGLTCSSRSREVLGLSVSLRSRHVLGLRLHPRSRDLLGLACWSFQFLVFKSCCRAAMPSGTRRSPTWLCVDARCLECGIAGRVRL